MVKYLLIFLFSINIFAQDLDPYDPFSNFYTEQEIIKDEDKPAEQLVFESSTLEMEGRLLDARTKLLLALKKDPNSILVHLMLADYYYRHVGYFRLVLKYIKRALDLFEQANGKAPYYSDQLKRLHADLLRRLADARLSLDNYQGALEVLDLYQSLGYPEHDILSSKSWILMKLNKIDEAIAVAKSSLSEGDSARVLNVLGILLSMKGERSEAIKIFEEAYKNELSLGSMGSPATPLNNVGEVYRETFQEDKAEKSWNKAITMPDGCEHVLPSLNLATLKLEAADYIAADQAINNFENCIAQFPLKNGEEHRALVSLIRARILAYTGNIDAALKLIDESLRKTQWFGKIGASSEDLKAAVLASYSYLLAIKNQHLSTYLSKGLIENLSITKNILINKLRIWWYNRKSLQILSSLNNFEDIYPRHTDSLLDYSALGFLTKRIPKKILESKILKELKNDTRSGAEIYYQAYLLESQSNSLSLNNLRELINKCRPEDLQLKLNLTSLLIKKTNTPNEAKNLTNWIFEQHPAQIINNHLKLPVNTSGVPNEIIKILQKTNYLVDNSQELRYQIRYSFNETHSFSLINNNKLIAKASETTPALAINKLNDIIFKEEL